MEYITELTPFEKRIFEILAPFLTVDPPLQRIAADEENRNGYITFGFEPSVKMISSELRDKIKKLEDDPDMEQFLKQLADERKFADQRGPISNSWKELWISKAHLIIKSLGLEEERKRVFKETRNR